MSEPASGQGARQDLETSRIEAFSDGVFAIAITLLVLELKAPAEDIARGALWEHLRAEWPQFGAYLTSFAIIGVMWVNHHSMFNQIVRADRALMFLNLLLLLWTAVLPFPTALVSQYLGRGGTDAHVAAALYSANLTLAAIAFSLIWVHAVRGGRLLARPMAPGPERASILRFSVGTFVYGATIGLSFVSAPVTLAVQFLIALYYAFEQIRSREA
ncbi:MAG TPA: TMEM175 family protein [Streptosporangiales bacterium]